jgi:hypothetical protein
MRIKPSSSFLCAAFFLLSAANLAAQDLGPHFKKIKEGIFVRAEKPSDSNAAIILTEEGAVLIDSGHNPPDSHALYNLLIERVGKMARAGKPLEEIKKELKMPEYDDWQGKDRFPNNIEAAYRAVHGGKHE